MTAANDPFDAAGEGAGRKRAGIVPSPNNPGSIARWLVDSPCRWPWSSVTGRSCLNFDLKNYKSIKLIISKL